MNRIQRRKRRRSTHGAGMNLVFHDAQKRKRKRRIRRLSKGGAMGIAVLLIIVSTATLIMVPAAADAYYSAISAKDQLVLAQRALKEQEIETAISQVQLAHGNFERSRKAMRALVPLRAVPYVGRQLKAARQLALAGEEITEGLDQALTTLNGILASLGTGDAETLGSITEEQKEILLMKLHESSPSLDRAETHIELAKIHVENAPDSALFGPIEEAVREVETQLPTIQLLMETASLAARIAPGVAGYPESQDYFLLFQNNTELRPSGGFIGSFGTLTVQNGGIKKLETRDSYSLDNAADIYVSPPWQLPRLSNPDFQSWYFRDSNWSPDFPTSAENALWFYREEGGVGDFAGVISLTPTFLENVLSLIGPVSLPERGETFTPENATAIIQYETNVGFDSEETRKEIIGELADVILEQIFALPKDKWIPFFELIQTSFIEKHLMLYLKDPVAAEFIHEQGWDASVNTETESDYLMVVDANLAALKTDQFIERDVDYRVDFSGERPKATVTLRYRNTAKSYNFKATRYRTWVRIFAPEGSQLIAVEGQDTAPDYYLDPSQPFEVVEESELGKVSFGTFVVTEIGEEREVTFTYALPERIRTQAKNEQYSLLWQKQPGVIEVNTTIDYDGLVNESKIEGEGEFLSDEGGRGGRSFLLRRDVVWSMPEALLRPTEPVPSLEVAL